MAVPGPDDPVNDIARYSSGFIGRYASVMLSIRYVPEMEIQKES